MKIDEIPYITEEILGSEKEALIYATRFYAKMLGDDSKTLYLCIAK